MRKSYSLQPSFILTLLTDSFVFYKFDMILLNFQSHLKQFFSIHWPFYCVKGTSHSFDTNPKKKKETNM